MTPLEEIKQFISEYNVKKHPQALEKSATLINKYPNDINLLQAIAITFAHNKKFDDAIKIFEKIQTFKIQSF